MCFDNSLANVKPEADSRGFASGSGHAKKPFKQVSHVLSLNTGTRVRNRNNQLTVSALEGNFYMAPWITVLNGV
jgi:hypothetical protein